MSEGIPTWAFDRAKDLVEQEPASPFVRAAFARYIAAHERPPVDPEIGAMDAALKAYFKAITSGQTAKTGVENALWTFRKNKEAGK